MTKKKPGLTATPIRPVPTPFANPTAPKIKIQYFENTMKFLFLHKPSSFAPLIGSITTPVAPFTTPNPEKNKKKEESENYLNKIIINDKRKETKFFDPKKETLSHMSRLLSACFFSILVVIKNIGELLLWS